MSGDLSRIDWHNHDGVNLAMINDFVRNQFYNRIIQANVRDCNVLDIGFGTGLLSMLALQHGARSITAYESDADRFLLGTEIIARLGLENKITLINDRFYHNYLDQYPNHVVVTETVNGNLWQEGLFNSLPRTPCRSFLPGKYFLNIYAVEIPRVFAAGLGTDAIQPKQFTPGVDLDPKFVQAVNSFYGVNSYQESVKLPTLKQVDPHVDTNWGWIPYMRCNANAHVIARYVLNAENLILQTSAPLLSTKQPVDFGVSEHTTPVRINTSGSLLLYPRAGMQHDTHTLFLDQGHWGPTLSPVIITDYTGDVVITHNFHNGDITYELAH